MRNSDMVRYNIAVGRGFKGSLKEFRAAFPEPKAENKKPRHLRSASARRHAEDHYTHFGKK